MFYNTIIIDLDDTLYNYQTCHKIALKQVFLNLQEKTNNLISISELDEIYKNINNKLKIELQGTSSSHNKSIYFKQLLESIKINTSIDDNIKNHEYLSLNYNYLSTINDLYWSVFYDNMVCNEGVKTFLEWNKQIGVKIGVLTDYETEYQIIKLKKLGLIKYIDIVVTSEEVGIEKPSVQMFQTILYKLKADVDTTIMIGDNFDKDIVGALNLNMYSYWFQYGDKNHIKERNSLSYEEFNNFKYLHNKFENIHTELIKLKYISNYCGERFDLVQAGGGNTSIKVDDVMYIKASGYHLTQINEQNGYVMINNNKLQEDIMNNTIQDVNKYNIIGKKRGSIETYMHSILKKYTIHLHPIQINKILISKKCNEYIKTHFPNSLLIEYDTPGIKVCNKIREVYNNEELIFLKNHGIILTTNNYEKIIPLLENTLNIFENILNINFDKYKYVNQISQKVNTNYENITYLCEDKIVNDYLINKKELFMEKITFPDALIFCGLNILFMNTLDEIKYYFEKYSEYPKILVINNLIYIINISLQKCKDTEDVLKGNLIILDTDDTEKTYLTNEEIWYLNNWDAEKYRKFI